MEKNIYDVENQSVEEYDFFISKDYIEKGYINVAGKGQKGIEQNKELFEMCNLIDDEILNQINSREKFFTIKDGVLVEVFPKVTRETSKSTNILEEMVMFLDSKFDEIPESLKDYLKGGG